MSPFRQLHRGCCEGVVAVGWGKGRGEDEPATQTRLMGRRVNDNAHTLFYNWTSYYYSELGFHSNIVASSFV